MGKRVDRVKTPISETQMAQAVIESWKQLFGNTPTKEQVGLVVAQNSLETGNRKSMWNYNVGNVTTDGKGSYDFYDDLTTDEQTEPGVWKKMNLKYRAYPSLMDGVKDYLRFLSGKRYSKAWQHIVDPDPAAFSKSLKEAGYYTANEVPYTRNMVKLHSQFVNSNSYENARSGKVEPLPASMPEEKKDLLQQYLAKYKGNAMDVYEQLAGKHPASSQPKAPTPANMNNLDSVLNNYLQMVAASEKTNKKLYKKYLPINHAVIKIEAYDYTSSIEFAHVLCAALDEELVSDSFIHTDGKNVEVECAIPGPPKDCFEAVKQLTQVLADTFKHATIKLGGLQVRSRVVTNKKSSYQQISLTAAETQHRKFLLKFI